MSKEAQGPETLESLVGETMSGIAGEAAQQSAAEQREAERRERRTGRERLAAFVLVPLFLILTVLNMAGFGWFRRGVPPPSSANEARAQATLLLSDAVDELELHFAENGRYPGIPDFIGPDGPEGEDEPFSYDLTGSDRYTLSVTLHDETVSFDSREDPDAVFREVRRGR